MQRRLSQLGRSLIVLAGVAIAAVASWWLFFRTPDGLTELLGVLLVIASILLGLRVAARLASGALPQHNVAEVAIEGPITRDGGGVVPTNPTGVAAAEIVEQIEAADADRGAEALLLTLNTPGGEVVPSDDIRRAAAEFEGPTVAYATDLCASGGYWIATGCDEFWAHDLSLVGSIGVIGSLVNATDLADRLGLSYERLAAGEYKDAGTPLKELEADEREYLQGLVDGYYDRFVDRITTGRDLDAEAVRATEARVYLGEEASDLDLVDAVGPKPDVEARLEELIGREPVIESFVPDRSLTERLRVTAAHLATAFGAGVAGTLTGEGRHPVRFK